MIGEDEEEGVYNKEQEEAMDIDEIGNHQYMFEGNHHANSGYLGLPNSEPPVNRYGLMYKEGTDLGVLYDSRDELKPHFPKNLDFFDFPQEM